MEWLQAPFAAGSLTWMEYGPASRHRNFDEQVKIFVLLGKTAAGWRSSRRHPWHKLPARSTSVCLGDVGTEAELTGAGHFFALTLEREYLGRRWTAASREHGNYGVHGASDPYLFHLAAGAAARLRREGALSPRYAESVALLASVHVRERYLQRRPVVLERPLAALAPHVEARVRTHIRTHLGEPLSLADLAAVAGVSTSHFAKAFRQSVGETPHRFLVRRRLEHACALLRADGKMTLAEAAFQVGFSTQSHFTRCFRAWCGLTPGEFLHKERLDRTRA